MPQRRLNNVDWRSPIEAMGRMGMPQPVRRDEPENARPLGSPPDQSLHRRLPQMPMLSALEGRGILLRASSQAQNRLPH